MEYSYDMNPFNVTLSLLANYIMFPLCPGSVLVLLAGAKQPVSPINPFRCHLEVRTLTSPHTFMSLTRNMTDKKKMTRKEIRLDSRNATNTISR